MSGCSNPKDTPPCLSRQSTTFDYISRPLEGVFPYVWLDATYVKVRQNHHIVSMAVVVAIGVRETGDRELLGFAVGASEEASFWLEFLRSLKARGLRGVYLVISDAHEGLKAALAQALGGATWQRCRVHFMRNLLAHVAKSDKSVVAALLRTIFAQPERASAEEQLDVIAQSMLPRWPQAAELLWAAAEDVLAYTSFPRDHWTRIYSTNPLERLNKEVKRRTEVVGIFPNVASVERLVGAILVETHEEWQVNRRYFSQESMGKLMTPQGCSVPSAPLHLEPVH